MSRKWYTLGLLVFAAACGGTDDEADLELEGMEAEEQTLPPATPPAAPMDTGMMGDTMQLDTPGATTRP